MPAVSHTAYQPLICASDVVTRSPIRPWARALRQTLRASIATRTLAPQTIAYVMNRIALLDAYQGDNDAALKACEAQIALWTALSRQTGNGALLNFVIQPWINVIRLERWQNRLDNAAAWYAELAPAQLDERGELNRRYGIAQTLRPLVELGAQVGGVDTEVMKGVYWVEYGRLLLAAGEHAKVQRHAREGLAQCQGMLRAQVYELLTVAALNAGEFDLASALLRQVRLSEGSPTWLAFSALGMYLDALMGDGKAGKAADRVLAYAGQPDHFGCSARNLSFMFSLSRVFRLLGMEKAEVGLLIRGRDMALELDDEAMSFEQLARLESLGEAPQDSVRTRFQDSSYAFIRRRLGLPGACDGVDLTSADVVRAVALLHVLDYEGCLRVLDEALMPLEAAMA